MNAVNMDNEKEEVVRHIHELETAENRKDIQGILELLTEDCVFVYRENKFAGKQGFEDMLRGSVTDFISSKHVPVRVEVSSSGDMAWLFGYELNQRNRDEGNVETKQYYLITFRKVDGKWKEVMVCLA